MARRCAICGKGPGYGHNVSHSERKTKRRFMPNLQRVRILLDGEVRRSYVCTRCIKANKITRVA